MTNWPLPLKKIIAEFQDCFDRMERYELLFDYANKLPHELQSKDWTEENRVKGCQSKAHVECMIDENLSETKLTIFSMMRDAEEKIKDRLWEGNLW